MASVAWRAGNGVTDETSMPAGWSATQASPGADARRRRRVDADRLGRARVRHQPDGTGVRRSGTSDARPGRRCRRGSATCRPRGRQRRNVRAAAHRWTDGASAWTKGDAEGTLHRRARQAQPRVAESLSPTPSGDRLVRHGSGRRARPRGQAAVGEHLAREYAPFEIQWGHASSPILHRDLADLRRATTARVLRARARQAHGRGEVESRSPGEDAVLQHAASHRLAARRRDRRQQQHWSRSDERGTPARRAGG